MATSADWASLYYDQASCWLVATFDLYYWRY